MEAMVVTSPEIIDATKWQKIPSWKAAWCRIFMNKVVSFENYLNISRVEDGLLGLAVGGQLGCIHYHRPGYNQEFENGRNKIRLLTRKLIVIFQSLLTWPWLALLPSTRWSPPPPARGLSVQMLALQMPNQPCISWQWHWTHWSSFFSCLLVSFRRWSSWKKMLSGNRRIITRAKTNQTW